MAIGMKREVPYGQCFNFLFSLGDDVKAMCHLLGQDVGDSY